MEQFKLRAIELCSLYNVNVRNAITLLHYKLRFHAIETFIHVAAYLIDTGSKAVHTGSEAVQTGIETLSSTA